MTLVIPKHIRGLTFSAYISWYENISLVRISLSVLLSEMNELMFSSDIDAAFTYKIVMTLVILNFLLSVIL